MGRNKQKQQQQLANSKQPSYLTNQNSTIGEYREEADSYGFMSCPVNLISNYYKQSVKLADSLYYFHCKHYNLSDQAYDYDANFKDWIEEYSKSREEDLHTGDLEKNRIPQGKPIHSAPSKDILFQNFDFFENSTWPVRFDSKFVSKVYQTNKNQVKYVYAYLKQLSQGIFDFGPKNPVFHVQCQDLPEYNAYFYVQLKHQKYLLFLVGVEKIPTFSRNSSKIKKFEYEQYMTFLDILSQQDLQKINQHTQRHSKLIQKDPSKFEIFAELTVLKKSKLPTQQNYIFEVQDNSQNYLAQNIVTCVFQPNTPIKSGSTKYVPVQFECNFLTNKESDSYILDESISRWMIADKKLELENRKYNEFKTMVNKSLVDKYADFSSAAKLVELLQKIPNFKIKLTQEEIEVVGQNGNVMVIGRSGTGKTTCAILRLFSIEMLFKIRVNLYQQKNMQIIKDTKIEASDLDRIQGLRCIFVTASPVLTNEVKRYYNKLTAQIKEELQKKKLRDREKKFQQINTETIKEEKDDFSEEPIMIKKQSKDEEKDEFEKEMANELQDIKLQKQISNEILDKELKEKEEDQKVEQDDEDNLSDHEDLQEDLDEGIKAKEFNAFSDLSDEDFPGFFTVKKLILMIDANLYRPFFLRSNSKDIVGQDAQSTWHNETKGVMMIDQYHKKIQAGKNEEEIKQLDQLDDSDIEDFEDEEELEQEYQRQLILQQKNMKKKQMEEKKLQNKNARRMAFEVDYDYFKIYFWPTVAHNHDITSNNLNASTVWTEIYSYIKGSASAHLYPGWYISQFTYVYQNHNGSSQFMKQEKKMAIYKIFLSYENWKNRQGGYDLMDVVNYILIQIKYMRYNFSKIHYMMIDEVQDLPHAILLLLMKITQQGLFFSGDTAQTIAQGVGFRFGDMNSVFDKSYFEDYDAFKAPYVKQLTVNFRSHNRILELANSIVTTIEHLFPQTIDKLKKERSNIDGPKPIMIQECDPELLFFILIGEDQFKSAFHSQNKMGQMKNQQALEFGCNQVIIVRNQEAKKKLPQVLQHALCLTVYEAKGLEFDDVILYNFFSDSLVSWNLMNQLQVKSEKMPKEQFLQTITKHEAQRNNDLKEDQFNKSEEERIQEKKKQELVTNLKEEEKKEEENEQEEEGDFENDDDIVGIFGLEEDEEGFIQCKKIVRKKQNFKQKKIDISLYSELCTEIKQLYVACTRPRNRLIFYDETDENKQYFQKFWADLNLVEFITKDVVKNIVESENQTEQKPVDQSESREISVFKSILNKANKDEWKKQGVQMFKHKYYEQAMKCFSRSGQEEMFKRAKAYWIADNSSKAIAENESELNYLENGLYNFKSVKGFEKKKIKKEIMKKKEEAMKQFVEAAQLFLELGKYRQAAQCYFSGKKFKEAEEIYVQIGAWRQAGEASYLQDKFQEAAEYYDKGKDFIRVIECFDILNDWGKILETVNKYREEIPEKDIEIFIRKYAPLALEGLVKNVEIGDDEKEEEGEEQEENKKNKDKKNSDGVIEEDEEEDESEEDSDEEEEDEEQENQEDGKNQEIVENQNEQLKQEQNKKENENEQIDLNQEKQIEDLTFDDQQFVEKSVAQQQKLNDQSNSSFMVVGDKSQLQEENKENQNLTKEQIDMLSFTSFNNDLENKPDDYEHLSHIDMDDEWLKMEKGSVIESISEARKSQSGVMSEFSAVEFNQMMSPNVQLVKTKGDIFIQDNVMQTIIKYITMFSSSFINEMERLKSANSLVTKRKDFRDLQSSEMDIMMDFVADLDNIDSDFVYLILDSLETFKVYKLCIFVCNRYNLSQRLGRYVLSLAQKYSPLSNQNASIWKNIVQAGKHRYMVLEKSYISSVAIHNILENINPEFLKGKQEGECLTPCNSLGIECYQGLVLLGYWKKILYMLDFDNALALTSAFGDFKQYKLIYLSWSQKYKKTSQEKAKKVNEQIQPDFEFLPFEIPINSQEIEVCLAGLDHIIQFNSLAFNGLNFYTTQYVEEFKYNLKLQNKLDELHSNLQFPSYFAYNGQLWNYLNSYKLNQAKLNKGEISSLQYNNLLTQENQNLQKYILSGFQNLYEILTSPLKNYQSDIIELRVYDLITFATMILQILQCNHQHNSVLYQIQEIIVQKLDYVQFMVIMDTSYQILRLLNESLHVNKFTKVLLRGLLTPYGIRLIENKEVLELINNNHVLIHRGSSIVDDLLNIKINKRLNIPQIKNLVFEEFFFADVDHDNIMAPLDVVLFSIKNRIAGKVRDLIVQKSRQKLNFYAITKKEINQNACQIAFNMGLSIVKNNIELLLKNYFQENLDEVQVTSKEKYQQYKKNDIVRRYKKLNEKNKQKQILDLIDGDEEILEYLSYNQHLPIARAVKNSKKQQKKKKINYDQQNNQFVQIPPELIKEFMQIIQLNVGKHQVKLDKQSLEAVNMIINYYMEKALVQDDKDSFYVNHKACLKIKLLTNFLGNDLIFYEFNNKLRKSSKSLKSSYQSNKFLDDAYSLIKHGIITDYSDCILDYINIRFDSLTYKQRFNLVNESILNSLLAYKVAHIKEKNEMVIPQYLLRYIDNLNYDVDSGKYKLNSIMLPYKKNEILAESVNWLRKIIEENVYESDDNTVQHILILALTVILNLDDYLGEILDDLLTIVDLIVRENSQVFPYYEKCHAYNCILDSENSNSLKINRQKLTEIQNDQDNILIFSIPLIQKMQILETVQIIDKSNKQKQEDQSYSDLYMDMKKLAVRIQAKQVIKKQIKIQRPKLAHNRAKLIKSPLIYYSVSENINRFTSNQYIKNILQFSIHNQGILELFRTYEKVKRMVLNTFLQTFVENSLDFHYMALQLRNICQEKNLFLFNLGSVFNEYSKEKVDELVKLFVKSKKDLQQREVSFNYWKEVNVKFEANVNKLLKKNKRIFSVKWYNRQGFNDKMKKLVKKRAGLKKQRALEIKKENLKYQK